MDTLGFLGLLSGLLGIFGFFFPVEWKNKLIIKIVFTFTLLILSSYTFYLNSKINKIERISRSANILIKEQSTEFTTEGFILAAMSFLEQNKKEFPDSYERAKKIFEKYNNDEFRSVTSVGVSYEMAGIIKGIGILSKVKED